MSKKVNTDTSVEKPKKKAEIKSRHWAMIVYPESLPDDWIDILTQTGLPIAISPIHDKDINEHAEGGAEFKKAHYHLIAVFSGPTTFNNVCKTLQEPLNAPIPKPIQGLKGAYDYLSHKNNPEKAQYDEKDIKLLNGFSIAQLATLTIAEITKIKMEIHRLIRTENITEYSDLMDYFLDNDLFDFYDVASNNTMFFDKVLTSRRHKQLSTNSDFIETVTGTKINTKTGEIITEEKEESKTEE